MRTILCTPIAALALLLANPLHAAAPLPATPQPAATQPAGATSSAQQVIPVRDFVRDDSFDIVKLSPSGKYIARTVNIGEKTVLVVQQRSDGKISGHFNLAGKTQVEDFWWVNDNRLIISEGERFGLLEKPRPTGELYVMNADGSGQDILVGWRAGQNTTGTHITAGKEREAVAAFMDASRLPNEPNKVIVAVVPLQGESQFTQAEEMDVNTGRRTVVANAPVRNANFTVDRQGKVRFAEGSGADNLSKTYYRDADGSDWQLLNDESVSNHQLTPMGFSADGHTAYLEQQEAKGPDGVYAFDTTTRKMQLQLRDPVADPVRYLHGPNNELIGVEYADAKPRTVFFDETSALAKAYRSLEASFPDQAVVITDYTSDGKLALVLTYSDRSPGDYYLFDLDSKKAVHLISHRDWIDPDRMGESSPVTLKARDGIVLHGFLTLPQGSNGKNLPLVVNPHGGPFGISDAWRFNPEVQLLASRGYAVLQVNYRGSGDLGRDFMHLGYRQWGGAMQDDVTDATRWAIAQGIADPHRICIYGASYGAYAALMGVAKEPDLYRCAIGYVGVYDLEAMYHAGDIQDTHSGTNYLKDALGEQNLEAISPVHLADRIKVPVMLVAGKEDKRAPPVHTEEMRGALQAAGKSVDTKIYDQEGHGFFIEADREDFYTRMLAFLDKNIGAGVAAASAGSTP
jgi:dipeptidyl aminopeptidase/acylaminoacyl peptidase